MPFLHRLCALKTHLPCAYGVWTFIDFALSAECPGLWSWLFFGFMRQCYELAPGVLVTFLVSLAAMILFGTENWFPSGKACLGNYNWGQILRDMLLSFCLL